MQLEFSAAGEVTGSCHVLDQVRIHDIPVCVAARVHTLGGFSAHGDQRDLQRWYAAEGSSPGLRIDPRSPADVRA